MIPTTDLISGFDESDLAKFLQACDPGTASQIKDLLGYQPVSPLATRAAGAGAGALFGLFPAAPVPPNPALPEIVLLHGITDCHLADTSGFRHRIWLDFLELFRGRFTRDLPLQADGVSDQPGVTLEPDGYVGKKYDQALAAWTAAGFRNRVFCYDWRRSIASVADHLSVTLRDLPSVRNGEKVVLAAHSMGGLVAAIFAARHPDWETLVSHCIFVGSPLGGSYSVPMTVLGHSPSFQKLDRLSLLESLEDFQRMAASFPGLLDMLPDPELMPDAADFYTQAGWPGPVKPLQPHLDASRALKLQIRQSPIFAKATHLISQGYATTSAMPWNAAGTDRAADISSNDGDSAALTLSSLIVPEVTAYLTSGEHGMLVNQPATWQAIMDIAQGRDPSLPVYGPARPGAAATRGAAPAAPVAPASLGLTIPPTVAAAIPLAAAAREIRVGEEMALHFSSQSSVRARTQVIGEPGFLRSALPDTAFSWQNSLSLAIASMDAYRSDQTVMVDRATRDWGFHGYEPFDNNETQGFVCWDDEVVVLSFRGTEKKISDWLRNFEVTKCNTAFGPVHQGFYNGYMAVEPILLQLLKKAGAENKKLWMTGHSLGAALAAIAGALLHDRFPAAAFATYGQPKVGEDPLAAFYSTHYSGRYFRFKNNNDIVTRVPPGFVHVGGLYWFDRNGELQAASRGALALAPEMLEQVTDLNAAEFQAMQASLNAATPAAVTRGFSLPFADYQIEGMSLLPSFGISDHSIADQYIPIIRKHVQHPAT